jgi:monofunctional biosynthetic peptidoglycan transglycosylase
MRSSTGRRSFAGKSGENEAIGSICGEPSEGVAKMQQFRWGSRRTIRPHRQPMSDTASDSREGARSEVEVPLARSAPIGQGSGMVSRAGGASLVCKVVHWLLGIGLALALVLAILVAAYRFAPPVSTLMLARWVLGAPVQRTYVPLEDISMTLRKAVVAAEDARFCRHAGVDWEALREVVGSAGEDGPARGASTIAMQTAKNLFLWPSRSYLRKAVEIPLALLVDAAWPKRRILEVYLNIAEWGDGVFGAEAAARHYFSKSADRIDAREAALLATALPDPRRRDAARPTRGHAALARRILARMQGTDPEFVACVR